MKNNLFNTRMDFIHYDKAHNSGSKSMLSFLILVSVAMMVSGGYAVKQSAAIDVKTTAAIQAKSDDLKIRTTEFKNNQEQIKFKVDKVMGLVSLAFASIE